MGFIRVASKGVYADGRCIDEKTRKCKLCRGFKTTTGAKPTGEAALLSLFACEARKCQHQPARDQPPEGPGDTAETDA